MNARCFPVYLDIGMNNRTEKTQARAVQTAIAQDPELLPMSYVTALTFVRKHWPAAEVEARGPDGRVSSEALTARLIKRVKIDANRRPK